MRSGNGNFGKGIAASRERPTWKPGRLWAFAVHNRRIGLICSETRQTWRFMALRFMALRFMGLSKPSRCEFMSAEVLQHGRPPLF
jgi:hypothetical protein